MMFIYFKTNIKIKSTYVLAFTLNNTFRKKPKLY